jgi:uncharacterized membrane protein
MNWFLLAIFGHAANGVAFVIDKALLSTAFKRSATYAGLVGILSTLVVVAIPWVDRWPTGNILTISIVSGALFVLALWSFFAALARAEASRIVPIVGSLIPVLTLIGTVFALDERLNASRLIGFALLVVATTILSSSGGASRPPRAAIGFALLSATLFAISSVTAKAAYDAAGFLAPFLTSRFAAVVASLILVTVIDPNAGTELRGIIALKRSSKRRSTAGLFAFIGQSLGALGFLLVQLATAQGSAAIVNALQAVQYALLVLAAFVLRRRAPTLLGETLTPRVVGIKLFALALTAAGLALVI